MYVLSIIFKSSIFHLSTIFEIYLYSAKDEQTPRFLSLFNLEVIHSSTRTDYSRSLCFTSQRVRDQINIGARDHIWFSSPAEVFSLDKGAPPETAQSENVDLLLLSLGIYQHLSQVAWFLIAFNTVYWQRIKNIGQAQTLFRVLSLDKSDRRHIIMKS